jgi:hypothetical protein
MLPSASHATVYPDGAQGCLASSSEPYVFFETKGGLIRSCGRRLQRLIRRLGRR